MKAAVPCNGLLRAWTRIMAQNWVKWPVRTEIRVKLFACLIFVDLTVHFTGRMFTQRARVPQAPPTTRMGKAKTNGVFALCGLHK